MQKSKARFFYAVTTILTLVCLLTVVLAVLMLQRSERNLQSNTSEASQTESVLPASSVPTESVQSAAASEPTESAVSQAAETAAAPFEQNRIDQTLKTRIDAAETIADVLNIYNNQIEEWKKAIQSMNSLLVKEDAAYSAKQTQWEKDTASVIAKREAEYEKSDGTQSQIALATEIYEMYQQRGKTLYTELTKSHPNYTI